MQNRFKSKVFWLGILSVVVIIMNNYGLFDVIKMSESTFKSIFEIIINIIFSAFAVFAMANNPTNKNKF